MMSLLKPTAATLQRFLATESHKPFTYAAVGATAATPPAGFVVDHTRALLGKGELVFQSATTALQRWQHFDLGWVEAWPSETPIRSGETIVIMGRSLGLWWLNSCRIIYIVDELGSVIKYGFAYGTLPVHAERGEERFLIEWDTRDNSVWYDILAFSKPNYLLARLGYPFVRRVQKQFARDSVASMQKAVVSSR